MAKKAKTLGELIDEMSEVRDQRRELATQDKELKTQYDELEEQVLKIMQTQGLERAGGEVASASVSESEVPSVVDWNKVTAFIQRNKAFYLFERRLSAAAWKELVATRKGRPLPGVDAFTKTKLNLRAV